jgi:hypothetical protein
MTTDPLLDAFIADDIVREGYGSDPKITAFLDDIVDVCRKHGMVLATDIDLYIMPLDETGIQEILSAEDMT